jgi:hypothetical protein
MKTTIEIPDALFRRAKAAAATEGISLKQLLTDALQRRLGRAGAEVPLWKSMAGELRDLRAENRRIDRVIEQEFERVDEDEA